MHIDVKVLVWVRHEISEGSLSRVGSLYKDYYKNVKVFGKGEILLNTEVTLFNYENENLPTMEIYDDEGRQIWNNTIEYNNQGEFEKKLIDLGFYRISDGFYNESIDYTLYDSDMFLQSEKEMLIKINDLIKKS